MRQYWRNYIKASCLLLAFMLTFLLFACAKDEPSASQTEQTTTDVQITTEQTTAEPEEISLLDEGGKAVYHIVRPENGSDSEIQAGIDLNKLLKELTCLMILMLLNMDTIKAFIK